MKILLKNAWLLDAVYQSQQLDLLVEDRKIAAAGEITDNVDLELDCTGCTLLPGFIDAHVHVAMKDDCFPDEALLAWAWNGVTTVRELGMLCTMPQDLYAAWIAVQNEKPESARLIATGKYIDVAGGYGAGPDPRRVVGNIVKDAEDARRAVREAHVLGFPGIKIGIADGVAGAPRLSNEMIRAICQEADALGMFTTCHIGLSSSLADMVSGGIGEAAHTPSDVMPQSLIDEMAKKGIAMITTIGDPERSPEPPDPPEMEEMLNMIDNGPGGPATGPGMSGSPGGPGGKTPEQKLQENRNMKENCFRLYRAGGKVVIGTDLMRSRDFRKDAVIPAIELRQLVEAGIPFHEAVKAGTLYAAQAVGTDKEEGTLEPGKLANLIVVPGRVDASFEALNHVPFVMHYGKIIRNELFAEVIY